MFGHRRQRAGSRLARGSDGSGRRLPLATRVALLLSLGWALPGVPAALAADREVTVVARGEASIYLRLPRDTSYREKVWDHAAGSLVLEEAGGRVSDLDGRPLDFSGGRLLGTHRGIVCTNGAIHDQVLVACRAELGID